MQSKFRVWFTNVTGCATGISDISLFVNVTAKTESEAIQLAVQEAQVVNGKSGMPPHGIQVSETELRKLAVVVPDANA